jgi:hypothetical protein
MFWKAVKLFGVIVEALAVGVLIGAALTGGW